jgi:cyclopropane-fatty-acyl-phospholipid synthase
MKSSFLTSPHREAEQTANPQAGAAGVIQTASAGERAESSFGSSFWNIAGGRRIVERLQHHWRGPAVRLSVAGRTFVLGSGPATSEIVIHRPALLLNLWKSPDLTFGEAFTRGDIDVNGDFKDFMKAIYLTEPEALIPWYCQLVARVAHAPRRISSSRALANARFHYDIGNDFYRRWLDPTLTYSCAYFLHDTDDLEAAQRQKLELLCRKARLAPGQKLLDIGCGWGSLLIHAAKYFGVHATGITPAEEQANYVEQLAKREGLSDRVRVLRGGWRGLDGTFDRIISVGMFEHVGLRQYAQFFDKWQALLAAGGLSILHCIGRTRPGTTDAWTEKYIFPGGYLPTLAQIARYSADAKLCVLDVENLKQHYSLTLEHWIARFSKVVPQVDALRGPEFSRRWWLYLHGALAGFCWGDLQLWQTVLSKDGDHRWPLNRQIELAASPASTLRTLAPRTRAKQNSSQISSESCNVNLS